MDKKIIVEALNKLKEHKKRSFSQSFDLIVNLKDIDLKKTENQVDFFAQTPNGTGKKVTVCALVDQELAEEAKKACDEVILIDDFQKYGKNKKIAKKLARKYDYFLAQGNLMGQVATNFGRALGPKGKMPNPKAGCIVNPKSNLNQLHETLQRTIRVSARTAPIIQCLLGKETMELEKVAENAASLYEQIIHHLPNEESNIKSAMVKLTMSPPIKIK
ncbi:50S ribosomal protein L1 [Candidatus Woesearchaeota archaeon]|nr:50S ribosomal protein L1 [Candidatus Woesearchaeota archaeon]